MTSTGSSPFRPAGSDDENSLPPMLGLNPALGPLSSDDENSLPPMLGLNPSRPSRRPSTSEDEDSLPSINARLSGFAAAATTAASLDSLPPVPGTSRRRGSTSGGGILPPKPALANRKSAEKPPSAGKRKSSSDETGSDAAGKRKSCDAADASQSSQQPKKKKPQKNNFFDFDSLIKTQTFQAAKADEEDDPSSTLKPADGQFDTDHDRILKRMTVKTESSLKFPPRGFDLFRSDRFQWLVDAEAANENPNFNRLAIAFGSSFSGLSCLGGIAAAASTAAAASSTAKPSGIDSIIGQIIDADEKDAVLLLLLTLPETAPRWKFSRRFAAFDDSFGDAILNHIAERKSGVLSPKAFIVALSNLGLTCPDDVCPFSDYFRKAVDWASTLDFCLSKKDVETSPFKKSRANNSSDVSKETVAPFSETDVKGDKTLQSLKSLLHAISLSFHRTTEVALETAKIYANLMFYLLWDEKLTAHSQILVHDCLSLCLLATHKTSLNEDRWKQVLSELASDFWSTVNYFIRRLPNNVTQRGLSSTLHKLHDILHVFRPPLEIPLRRNLAFRALLFISSSTRKAIKVDDESRAFLQPTLPPSSSLSFLVQAARFLHHLTTTGISEDFGDEESNGIGKHGDQLQENGVDDGGVKDGGITDGIIDGVMKRDAESKDNDETIRNEIPVLKRGVDYYLLDVAVQLFDVCLSLEVAETPADDSEGMRILIKRVRKTQSSIRDRINDLDATRVKNHLALIVQRWECVLRARLATNDDHGSDRGIYDFYAV